MVLLVKLNGFVFQAKKFIFQIDFDYALQLAHPLSKICLQ